MITKYVGFEVNKEVIYKKMTLKLPVFEGISLPHENCNHIININPKYEN